MKKQNGKPEIIIIPDSPINPTALPDITPKPDINIPEKINPDLTPTKLPEINPEKK